MIANSTFQTAGPSVGSAQAWTVRSSCARESIAPFTPSDNAEGFERWSAWTDLLGIAVLAPFVPNGTMERFDVWPNPLFAFELTGGLVGAILTDGFDRLWWTGRMAFTWARVPQRVGVFASGFSSEGFDAWQRGAVYSFAFPAGSLREAPLGGGPLELFVGWTTMNTTLG